MPGWQRYWSTFIERPTPRPRSSAKRVAALADDESTSGAWPQQLRDFYLPVSREQSRFLHQTVRAVRAQRVVEFGSSFGISTIYLAAGIRDNGGGIVIGSELVQEKAATARRNLTTAGLDSYAEIRAGDARQTLTDPGGAIDMVLLDDGPALYTEILQLLRPHLRPGTVVIADNIENNPDDPHSYASWIRDPAHGFVSSSITLKGGTEYSVWVAPRTPTTPQRRSRSQPSDSVSQPCGEMTQVSAEELGELRWGSESEVDSVAGFSVGP